MTGAALTGAVLGIGVAVTEVDLQAGPGGRKPILGRLPAAGAERSQAGAQA
jgi:hypothetical protein